MVFEKNWMLGKIRVDLNALILYAPYHIPHMGGITLSTDSYLPPEVEVRLVRLVPNRDYETIKQSV